MNNRCAHQRGASRRHHTLHPAASVLLALALALTGCASGPETQQSSVHSARVQELLAKAHASPLNMRAPYLFSAARLSLQDHQTGKAVQILREIDALHLNSAQHARRQLLAAQVDLQQKKPKQAVDALKSRTLLESLDQLTGTEQIEVSLLRARALYAVGDYFASAQERVYIEPMLPASQLEENHNAIRRALSHLGTAELQRYRAEAHNTTLRGWLDLALSAKGNNGAAVRAVPAGVVALPAGSVNFNDIPAQQPQQVALLLPLTGRLAAFGKAVRDGFLAAWYAAQQRGDNPPPVRIYDSESAGIVQLYQQAVQNGAGVVVGPLQKLQVAQFYQQQLPVPLLALNRADSTQPPPANLYQFSLAPEDETQELAQTIWDSGRHNVMVIADADDADSREEQAFLHRWESLGGKITGTAIFNGRQDMSSSIRDALNISRSMARARRIENLLHRKIEFTPRRRRDVDAVFMLASATQARSIKPLLNFYYAGSLPVYSTSRIYSGYPGGTLDHDLDGVRITAMPWILQSSPLKLQILADQPNSKNYLRLYAMGVDSFNLYPRLQQLGDLGDKRVAGQTGLLSLDAQRIVRRHLLLAVMHNGSAEPYDNAMESDNAAPENSAD